MLNLLSLLFITASSFAGLPNLEHKDLVSDKLIQVDWKDRKANVLIFLSSSCPCSDSHIAHINELTQAYPDVRFIGVHSNANESLEDGVKYFSEKKINFPVFRDAKSEWANRLRALRTPHAFLIDQKGEIAYQGGVTSSSDPKRADAFYLKTILKKFLNDEKIDRHRTRVLGCEIARE